MVLSKVLAIMQERKLITITVSRKIGTLFCKSTIYTCSLKTELGSN